MNGKNQNWMGYDPQQLIPRLRGLCADLEVLSAGGSINLPEDLAEIEEWTLLKRTVPCLTGLISGHPFIRNGDFGATTEIYYLDQKLGMARSLSRWYKLGDAMSEQESQSVMEALLKL